MGSLYCQIEFKNKCSHIRSVSAKISRSTLTPRALLVKSIITRASPASCYTLPSLFEIVF